VKSNLVCTALKTLQPLDIQRFFSVCRKIRHKICQNSPKTFSLLRHQILITEITIYYAEIDFRLNNKMARKTFASLLYFNKDHPMLIHLLQIILRHMNVKNRAHYLRISDDDIAAEIDKIMFNANKLKG
jgi:hypothetical protein